MSIKNNEKPCTWNEKSDCTNCQNKDTLNCKWKSGHLTNFYAVCLPILFCHILGLVIIGIVKHTWIPLIGYILFFPIILGIFEIKFLCSHCPFYSGDGIMLRCLANHGLLKLWKYNPNPMSRLEKFLMTLLVIVLIIVMPFIIFTYNIIYFTNNIDTYGNIMLIINIGLAMVTLTTEFAGLTIMYNIICKKCVNFSCPFNRVEKKYVDEYLKKNKIMKDAWEKSGYKIG